MSNRSDVIYCMSYNCNNDDIVDFGSREGMFSIQGLVIISLVKKHITTQSSIALLKS